MNESTKFETPGWCRMCYTKTKTNTKKKQMNPKTKPKITLLRTKKSHAIDQHFESSKSKVGRIFQFVHECFTMQMHVSNERGRNRINYYCTENCKNESLMIKMT